MHHIYQCNFSHEGGISSLLRVIFRIYIPEIPMMLCIKRAQSKAHISLSGSTFDADSARSNVKQAKNLQVDRRLSQTNRGAFLRLRKRRRADFAWRCDKTYVYCKRQ
jgi:hypothetical protein